MNWNQYKKLDRKDCAYNAFLTLEDTMTLVTESLESIDESIESANNSNCDSEIVKSIKSVKTELNRQQDNLESIINQLRDYLESQ